MCHTSCIKFVKNNIKAVDVEGKRVLEVGSLDVNGSLRSHVSSFGPREYLGIDIQKGPGVDLVCNANDIISKFGKESFDVLISTEMLEHAMSWREVISNFKNVLKAGGVLFVTTRSKGSAFHDYPFDFWRYERSDMQQIFKDFVVEIIEDDREIPGIFIKARKPNGFVEYNCKDVKLFSILKEKRIKDISRFDIILFRLHRKYGSFLSAIMPKSVSRAIKKMLLGRD